MAVIKQDPGQATRQSTDAPETKSSLFTTSLNLHCVIPACAGNKQFDNRLETDVAPGESVTFCGGPSEHCLMPAKAMTLLARFLQYV